MSQATLALDLMDMQIYKGCIYQLHPLKGKGYRLEFWGTEGQHYWCTRPFDGDWVHDWIKALIDKLATPDYYCEGIEDISPCFFVVSCEQDESFLYRDWLICLAFRDHIECYDPKTDGLIEVPWGELGDEEAIAAAKDRIDQIERERTVPPGQLELPLEVCRR